jgi:Domain of unknown function (DUF4145)
VDDARPLVLYCPHCGNMSVQTKLVEQACTERSYWGTEAAEESHEALYTVTRCETCLHVLVYSDCEEFTEETVLGDLVFPQQASMSRSVPSEVKRFFLEAQRVKHASPTAFAVLARRVLEEVCRSKGVRKANLSASLKELAKQGVLPPVLAEASDLVRLVGNAGAHSSNTDVTVPQVWSIESFLKAVIEYLFIAPERIENFKASQVRAQEDTGSQETISK